MLIVIMCWKTWRNLLLLNRQSRSGFLCSLQFFKLFRFCLFARKKLHFEKYLSGKQNIFLKNIFREEMERTCFTFFLFLKGEVIFPTILTFLKTCLFWKFFFIFVEISHELTWPGKFAIKYSECSVKINYIFS